MKTASIPQERYVERKESILQERLKREWHSVMELRHSKQRKNGPKPEH